MTQDNVPAKKRASPRILLVEDDPINVEVTLAILSACAMVVDTAENGLLAVRRLEEGMAYDLIFMDMQMPVMGGLEATRRIRALANGREVPIIAMTANVFPDDRAACLATGMNDFVAKPTEPHRLLATLRTWLPGCACTADAMDTLAGEEKTRREQSEQWTATYLAFFQGEALGRAMTILHHDVEQYARLLRQFVARHGDAVASLNAHLTAGAFEEARARAHAIKGVVGSLGLNALQLSASTLEGLFKGMTKSGQPDPAISVALDELATQLARLRDAVARLPDHKPPASSALLTSAELDEMVRMLGADDTQAIQAVHAKEGALQILLGDQWDVFVRQVEDFDFQTALTILAPVREAGRS